MGPSIFDLGGRAEAAAAGDALRSPEVRKVNDHIAAHREEHVAAVQRDLRQPSVSSWNKGVKEMADLMVESFRKLGCRDVQLVPTTQPHWPGMLAHYDVGAPKTAVVYMMYDTQPWEEARWSAPPLEARRVKDFAGFPEVIVARGAINSKGPNRFTLNALESIIAVHGKLPVNVIFTCDGAEEQGSPNFHEVLDPWRDRLKKADALLAAEPVAAAQRQPSPCPWATRGSCTWRSSRTASAGAAARRRCRSTRAARPCWTARSGGWWRRCARCTTRRRTRS